MEDLQDEKYMNVYLALAGTHAFKEDLDRNITVLRTIREDLLTTSDLDSLPIAQRECCRTQLTEVRILDLLIWDYKNA